MAIAKTTQMLAHDIRKPFTMIRMLLDMLPQAESLEESNELTLEFTEEIDRALLSVNGMLQDIMEVGSKTEPLKISVNLEELIENVLADLWSISDKKTFTVEISAQHNQNIFVDALKIPRVFLNILCNAIQAMPEHGLIWIRTRQVVLHEKDFIEISIGNSGSYIASDVIPKLFEAFFTSGKIGGTGLGLAIAQKIVRSHGGEIRCHSKKEFGVEFIFTLPSDGTLINIPNSSRIIQSSALKRNSQKHTEKNADVESSERNQLIEKLKKVIAEKLHDPLFKINFHILDDESIYLNSFDAQIRNLNEIFSVLHVYKSKNVTEFKINLDITLPSIVVCDVDLGDHDFDGYKVVSDLRTSGFNGFICLHSNRISGNDCKLAIESGADLFLPKPINQIHLLKLILYSMSVGKKD